MSIKDCYNNIQVYLVDPVLVDYTIPYTELERQCFYGIYKTYHTCSVKGVNGGIRIQLNRIQAERFAVYNSLTIITHEQQLKIVEIA